MYTNCLTTEVTNAAGGLNDSFNVGDIVILNDVGVRSGTMVP